jgi:hypothetical protein
LATGIFRLSHTDHSAAYTQHGKMQKKNHHQQQQQQQQQQQRRRQQPYW